MLFYVPRDLRRDFSACWADTSSIVWGRRPHPALEHSPILFFSAFATAYSASALQLLIYRCTTLVGVSVEFVAATAWLAELFAEAQTKGDHPRDYGRRFSSTGGLLMSGANYLNLTIGHLLPAIHGGP